MGIWRHTLSPIPKNCLATALFGYISIHLNAQKFQRNGRCSTTSVKFRRVEGLHRQKTVSNNLFLRRESSTNIRKMASFVRKIEVFRWIKVPSLLAVMSQGQQRRGRPNYWQTQRSVSSCDTSNRESSYCAICRSTLGGAQRHLISRALEQIEGDHQGIGVILYKIKAWEQIAFCPRTTFWPIKLNCRHYYLNYV